MEPWPFDSTKRSRSNHSGSLGLNFRCRVNRAVAVSAAPSGVPGWPSPTRSIASIDRKWMALARRRGSIGAVIGSSSGAAPRPSGRNDVARAARPERLDVVDELIGQALDGFLARPGD